MASRIYKNDRPYSSVPPQLFGDDDDAGTVVICSNEFDAHQFGQIPGVHGLAWIGGTASSLRGSDAATWRACTEDVDLIGWGIEPRAWRLVCGLVGRSAPLLPPGKIPQIADELKKLARKTIERAEALIADQAKRMASIECVVSDHTYLQTGINARTDALVDQAYGHVGIDLRFIGGQVHRLEDDGFWTRMGMLDAVREGMTRHGYCSSCKERAAADVLTRLRRDWEIAGRPTTDSKMCIQAGRRNIVLDIEKDSLVYRDLSPDDLITIRPERDQGEPTIKTPDIVEMFRREWRLSEDVLGYLRASLAKALVPEAMMGDDDVLNIVSATGTGKGTLFTMLRAMLGQDRVLNLIEFDDRTHSRIERALYVVVNEADEVDYRVLHRILGLTDEPMDVRRHYQDPYQAHCRSRFIFTATLPITRLDAQSGWARRYKLIRGLHPGRTPEEIDDSLKSQYQSLEQTQRMFWWLMRSDLSVLRDVPREVLDAASEHLLEADDYASFVYEWLDEEVGANCTTRAMHEKFLDARRPRSESISRKDRGRLLEAVRRRFETSKGVVHDCMIRASSRLDEE